MASLQLFRRYDDGDAAADCDDLTTTTSGGQLQLIRVSETPSASEELYGYDEMQDEAMTSDDIIIEPRSYRKRSSKSGGGLFKTVVEGTGAGYAGVKQYLDGDLSPYKTSPRQSDEKDSFSSGGQTEMDGTGMSENDGSVSAENDPGFSEASHEPSKPAEAVSEQSEPSNEESTTATAINLESDSSEAESLGIRGSMEAKLGSEAEETEDTQPKLETDSVDSTETQASTQPKTEFDEGNVESVQIADYEKPADVKTEPEMSTEELLSTESMKKKTSDKPITSYVEALKEGLSEIVASDEQSSVEMPNVEQDKLPDLTGMGISGNVSQLPKKESSGDGQTDVEENESAGDGQTDLPEKGSSGNVETQLLDAKSVTDIAGMAEKESSGDVKSVPDMPEKESSGKFTSLANLPEKETTGAVLSESDLSNPEKKHSGDVFINDDDGTRLSKTESSVQIPTVDDLLKEESTVHLPTVDDLPKKESSVQIRSDDTVKAENVRNLPVPEMDLPAAVEASWSGSSSRLPTITISEASEGDAALVAVAKVITCTKDETKTVTAIATGSSVEDEGRHSQPAQPHRMGPLERFRNKVREKLSQVRLNKGRKECPVDEFGDLFNVYGSSSPR